MPINLGVLGTQYVTIPMTVGVVLASAVLTVQTPWSSRIFPYLGVGAGVARLSIKGANSTNPSEPGINNFDSAPAASGRAFAVQFKAGLKGEVARSQLLFADYRYLTLNPAQYTFGETLPSHLPTDSWTVSLGRESHNLFVAGLQLKFWAAWRLPTLRCRRFIPGAGRPATLALRVRKDEVKVLGRDLSLPANLG